MKNNQNFPKPSKNIRKLMTGGGAKHRIFGSTLTVVIVLVVVTGIAFAAVYIVFVYPTTTNSVNPAFYLEQGPNYKSASQLELVHSYLGTPSEITSGTTLDINVTTGSNAVYLLNVFTVVNGSSGVTGPVYLYINGTLPAGVTLYFDNASEMTFTGTAAGVYTVVNGGGSGNGSLFGTDFSAKVPLTAAHTLYISFEVLGTASGGGTLYLQTSV